MVVLVAAPLTTIMPPSSTVVPVAAPDTMIWPSLLTVVPAAAPPLSMTCFRPR